MKVWPFLYSLQFETGVIRAGVNGAGVKKGPALKGPIKVVNATIRAWALYKVRCLTQVIVSIPWEEF